MLEFSDGRNCQNMQGDGPGTNKFNGGQAAHTSANWFIFEQHPSSNL